MHIPTNVKLNFLLTKENTTASYAFYN